MKNEDANGQRTPGEGDDSRADDAQRGDSRDDAVRGESTGGSPQSDAARDDAVRGETSGGSSQGEAAQGDGVRRVPQGDAAQDEPKGRTTKLRLDQFLKLRGLVFTGGEAKMRIQTGEVSVNGELETRRGRGLRPGDRVSIGGMELEVESELFESEPPPPRRSAR